MQTDSGKKLLCLLFLLFLLPCRISEAAEPEWVCCDENRNETFYYDSGNIKPIEVDGQDFLKAQVKVVSKSQVSATPCGVYTLWIDRENERFRTVYLKMYDRQGKLKWGFDMYGISPWQSLPDKRWGKTIECIEKAAEKV